MKINKATPHNIVHIKLRGRGTFLFWGAMEKEKNAINQPEEIRNR